ncbi:MAG: DEAD/DEAH box helicase [Synergistaceae bacterium]|jgi:superfamily II RNA helicase|nr:DEAD/DEAH box helicase [Synergistaceae bacterium]
MLYEWQEHAVERVLGKNAILSAPTGSGKTWVAYRWAKLMDADGIASMPSASRVIFTAPIKALSNERYLDLRRMGFDVGLETGDFKKNPGAQVLCCTQEIYTIKYAHIPNQRVIVDEFHFIFGSPERTRAYIDGIRGTSLDSKLLVMSATFGDPDTVRDYLEEMTRRNFELFETNERVTKLIYRKKGIHYSRIHDALVFVFSRRGAEHTATQIARTRKKIGRSDRARLREMAEILEVTRIPETMLYGVGVYYGSLYPKEKLLVEMAFRERILDVVAGTDALSLGVNLPAESVVFAQMAKYVDGPLTHNEFLQMAGRAGRKGYFDTGFVSFIPRSRAEHHDFDTETLYRQVLASPREAATIALQPAVGKLLKQHITVEQEARMIADCSLPRISYDRALVEVEELLLLIQRTLGLIKDRAERKKLKLIMADLWFDEMSVTSNFAIAHMFATEKEPDALKAAEILSSEERNYLQALLKVKRYAGRMPDGYRFSNMERVDATVERIDVTVFGFEEKIRALDITEDSWSFHQNTH